MVPASFLLMAMMMAAAGLMPPKKARDEGDAPPHKRTRACKKSAEVTVKTEPADIDGLARIPESENKRMLGTLKYMSKTGHQRP
jgi:hypothetical protein